MKRKIVFGVVVLLLVLQTQTVFAADYDEKFCKELNDNDIDDIEDLVEKRAKQMNLVFCMDRTIRSPLKYNKDRGNYNTDKFIKANCLEVLKLLVKYGADVNKNYSYVIGSSYFEDEYPLELAIKEKHPLTVIKFLLDSGANPNFSHSYNGHQFSRPLTLAYTNGDMTLVNLLLDHGANGAFLLPDLYGAMPGDNQMIQLLISRGVQIRSEQGAETLRKATETGHFDIVKLLVVNGVNVNARDSKGITALSVAYDKGEMEIYNYLKANGAIEFEPKQVAQPPAPAQSTTNVYVQPSAPSSSSSSSGSSTPSRNIGKEIAEAFTPPLDSGTYGLVGTQVKLRLAGIAKSGMLSYTNKQGKTVNGYYNIDGDRMTVQVEGNTYMYTITSKTSFSGHGETWVRTGY